MKKRDESSRVAVAASLVAEIRLAPAPIEDRALRLVGMWASLKTVRPREPETEYVERQLLGVVRQFVADRDDK